MPLNDNTLDGHPQEAPLPKGVPSGTLSSMARQTGSKLGRPPVQQAAVRDALCQRIVRGEWQPGERLPPRLTLVRQLDTTNTTLQSALAELMADGLVVSRGVHGTFVHEQSPHRFHYGVLLPESVDVVKQDTNRFWLALARAARQPRDDGRSVAVYHGLHRQARSDSFDRLIAELGRHRLAGLLVVAPPAMFANTAVLSSSIPRVFISGGDVQPGDLDLGIDWNSFRSLAVARLAARGVRRVALIGGAGSLAQRDEVARWMQAFAAAGIGSRPQWCVSSDLLFPAPLINHLRLVLDDAQPPDGLLVSDDNLLPTVLAALASWKLRADRDIQIVAHANFPLADGEPAGIERIGFDARHLLDAAIAGIDARHQGDRTLVHLPPVPAVSR